MLHKSVLDFVDRTGPVRSGPVLRLWCASTLAWAVYEQRSGWSSKGPFVYRPKSLVRQVSLERLRNVVGHSALQLSHDLSVPEGPLTDLLESERLTHNRGQLLFHPGGKGHCPREDSGHGGPFPGGQYCQQVPHQLTLEFLHEPQGFPE
jgi:hypothetical protein